MTHAECLPCTFCCGPKACCGCCCCIQVAMSLSLRNSDWASLLKTFNPTDSQIGHVSQPRDQIRGSVLCLQASMINHDCLPNTARFDHFDAPGDRNTCLSFRALQDIPAGEEITHQYFPLDWSLEERQEQCQDVFGFHCNCGRCQVTCPYVPPSKALTS